MVRKCLPLPIGPDFFRCQKLHATDKRLLIQHGLICLDDVLRETQSLEGSVQWSHRSTSSQNVKLYDAVTMDKTSSSFSSLCFMATTEIHATLEEASALMQIASHKEFEQYCRVIEKDVVDCASLYTLAMPTVEHPRNYVGIKWMATGSPAPTILKQRDVCFVEFQDDFRVQERRGWGRAYSSVDLAACPSMQQSHDLVRMHVNKAAYLFTETDQPGTLFATSYYHVDMGGQIPSWICEIIMRRKARSLAYLERQFQCQRLERSSFVSAHKLLPASSYKSCNACSFRFGVLSKKTHCLKCGHVVCSGCHQSWRLGRDRIRVNVCTRCLVDSCIFKSSSKKDSDTTISTDLNARSSEGSIRQSSVVESTTMRSGIKLLDSPMRKALSTIPPSTISSESVIDATLHRMLRDRETLSTLDRSLESQKLVVLYQES